MANYRFLSDCLPTQAEQVAAMEQRLIGRLDRYIERYGDKPFDEMLPREAMLPLDNKDAQIDIQRALGSQPLGLDKRPPNPKRDKIIDRKLKKLRGELWYQRLWALLTKPFKCPPA